MHLPTEDCCGAYQDIPSLDSRQPLEIPVFGEKNICLPSLEELDRMTEIKVRQQTKKKCSSRKEDDNDIEKLALEVTQVLSKRNVK